MFFRIVAGVFFVMTASCGSLQSNVEGFASETAFTERDHWYPKEDLTPGHLCSVSDADFDEFRYGERIPHCRRNVSKAKKISVSGPYGVGPEELPEYQVDHLIPLAIGGSNSSLNLWPVPFDLARAKARFEFETFELLQSGAISQTVAIERIFDWVQDNLID